MLGKRRIACEAEGNAGWEASMQLVSWFLAETLGLAPSQVGVAYYKCRPEKSHILIQCPVLAPITTYVGSWWGKLPILFGCSSEPSITTPNKGHG